MSDEQTTRTDAAGTTGTANTTSRTASATMPPTPPIGAEPTRDEPAGTPLDRASDVATEAAKAVGDAAKAAGARIKEAAEQADLDQFADDAKRVAGEWTEKVKDEYRRRPGVVIGAAVAGVVVLAAIARAVGRR